MFKKILTELKKTKWPTGKELLVLTVYTVILCAVVAIAITGLDLAFFKIRDWYINVNIF
ncbi:MAG: preprotein translocase subunit SecE [Candidatus Dojkabacteria bacterium]|jgi:preprotein translocase SecE subunit|nr:preprotein translocase subunit SecE [Candidatus Dojkabacteria bacterium]